VQVSLSEDHHPTEAYVQKLRSVLAHRFPGVIFYELPVDMVTQILNFGLPAPIDVQVVGPNLDGNRAFAEQMLNRLKYVPGTTDMRIQQPFDNPLLYVNVDRTKAQQVGLQQRDVAQSLLVATSGSFQTSPTFWLNPKTGVSYSIAVQSPQYDLDTMQDLQNIPLTAANGPAPGAVTSSGAGSPIVAADTPMGGQPIQILGNVASITPGLIGGLIFSIFLVYLLIVVNFQSWLDPFIVVSALPAALSGIVWFLFITHTRISVPALTGSIMCMGVATSNSILVISFAREQLEENVGEALNSALNAGYTRFRPVLMTALAMIIGMIPMALGLGDGGEQNAPLGRAVIGGLLFATVSTLFFVPTFFSVLHGRLEKKRRAKLDRLEHALPETGEN
jgi:multidrug efflux pump subunit AcrB